MGLQEQLLSKSEAIDKVATMTLINLWWFTVYVTGKAGIDPGHTMADTGMSLYQNQCVGPF